MPRARPPHRRGDGGRVFGGPRARRATADRRISRPQEHARGPSGHAGGARGRPLRPGPRERRSALDRQRPGGLPPPALERPVPPPIGPRHPLDRRRPGLRGLLPRLVDAPPLVRPRGAHAGPGHRRAGWHVHPERAALRAARREPPAVRPGGTPTGGGRDGRRGGARLQQHPRHHPGPGRDLARDDLGAGGSAASRHHSEGGPGWGAHRSAHQGVHAPELRCAPRAGGPLHPGARRGRDDPGPLARSGGGQGPPLRRVRRGRRRPTRAGRRGRPPGSAHQSRLQCARCDAAGRPPDSPHRRGRAAGSVRRPGHGRRNDS